MIATCDIIFNDQENIYDITVFDEKATTYNCNNIEDLLTYCKSQDIKQLFFYNGKVAFSYFTYFVLINNWKVAARTGYPGANSYRDLVSATGERYTMLLGLGNKKTLRLRNLSLIAKGGLDNACRDFCAPKGTNIAETTMNLLLVLHKSFLDLTDIDIIDTTEGKFLTIGAIAKKYQLGLMEEIYECHFHERYDLDEYRNKMLMSANTVRGGVCCVNPKYRGKTLNDCRKYDYNSSYPYIMRNYPMPTGKATASKNIPNDGKLHFILFSELHMRLKPNRVAIYSNVNTGLHTPNINYYEEDKIWLWEEELNALSRYYDIDYKIKVCWSFIPQHDKGMIAYVDKFYQLKQTATGARRTCIKLLLNSIFGKFGENIYRDKVYYELKEGIAQKQIQKVDHTDNHSLGFLSVIVSSYIAAMGRARLLNELLDICGDHLPQDFVYCDTDCIVIRGDYKVKTSKTELGAFKDEGHFTAFKVLAKKTYIGYCGDSLMTVHAPGVDNSTLEAYYKSLNQDEGIAAFNYNITFECPMYYNKMGGIILGTTTRKLSDCDALKTNGIFIKE